MTKQDPTAAALESLQKEMQALRREMNDRVAALEARLGATEHAVEEYEAAQEDALTEDTVAVIAAAVTAFLGKKVRVRAARRIYPSGSNSWAQQGRAIVQASHNLFSR